MGKIKGWSKISKSTWQNKQKTRMGMIHTTEVCIDRQPPRNRQKNWRVQITSNSWIGVVSRTNLTKEKANAFAVNWMKNHPKG